MKLEKPIQLPSSPFWEIFKTFGRDELLAGIVSILATLIVSHFLAYVSLSAAYTALCLALAGPVFEKLGFFLGHFKDAYEVYSTTPVSDRRDLGFYLKRVFKGGATSLFWDILVHDPLYVGLMLFGMYVHPESPAWLLVPIAFGIAVLVVAFIRVGIAEIGYRLLARSMRRKGFNLESYYEARFFVSADEDPARIIDQLKTHFLPAETAVRKMHYDDSYYFEVDLPEYNARSPQLRIRTRFECTNESCLDKKENSWMRTAQLIYKRAVEHHGEGDEQFRFFPTRKDKFYKFINKHEFDDTPFPGMPSNSDGLGSFLEKDWTRKDVHFIRRVAKHSEKIYISVDSVEKDNVKFHVVEIKAYLDRISLLKEAMRFIMTRFNVLQTTQSKIDLLR